MSAHLVIAVFLLIVCGSLVLFLFLLLKPQQSPAERESELCDSIAGLSSASAPDFRTLFADTDYRMLSARPELKSICAKYRSDRRRIALLWLGELERDVLLVWEFRRFLVRNGLPVTFQEELGIAFAGSLALIYLNAIRFSVLLFGPFVLPGALHTAKSPVVRLSRRGAGLLDRAPADTRNRLQQKWSQHVLSWVTT